MSNLYDEYTNKELNNADDSEAGFSGSFEDILASLKLDIGQNETADKNEEPDLLSSILGGLEKASAEQPKEDNTVFPSVTADPIVLPAAQPSSAPIDIMTVAHKSDPESEQVDAQKVSVHQKKVQKKAVNTADSAPSNKKKGTSAPNRQMKPDGKDRSGKMRAHRLPADDVYNEENWEPYAKKLKKSKLVFAIGLSVYLVIFVAAAVLGVSYLHTYLNAYEKTRPEYYMETLMPTMSADDWYNLMLDNSNVAPTDFETENEIYQAYYDAIVTSDDISYRKKLGLYSDEHPVYAVKIGNTDIVHLYLEEDVSKSAGCGFNYWKLAKVEALADGSGLKSASIEIDAPVNAELYLNGVRLTDKYIVDDKVPYQLSELEARFDVQPYKLKYRVEGLYLNYELTDGAGNVLEAYKQEDTCFYYDVDQTERWSFKVSAMSDMTVCVNGAQLNAEDAIKTSDYPVLAGFDDYIGDVPTIKTWSYSNLLTQPVITCVDSNGNPVEAVVLDDGTYTFSYSPSSEVEEKHKDRALGFIKAYIKYATDDSNATDTNYYRLVNYVLADSELRDFFYSSYIGGMHWAKVLEYEVHDIQVSNFIAYSDDCFSCTGYFNITQSTYYETRNYETTYTLVFVKSGGEWYVVRMDDSISYR